MKSTLIAVVSVFLVPFSACSRQATPVHSSPLPHMFTVGERYTDADPGWYSHNVFYDNVLIESGCELYRDDGTEWAFYSGPCPDARWGMADRWGMANDGSHAFYMRDVSGDDPRGSSYGAFVPVVVPITSPPPLPKIAPVLSELTPEQEDRIVQRVIQGLRAMSASSER